MGKSLFMQEHSITLQLTEIPITVGKDGISIESYLSEFKDPNKAIAAKIHGVAKLSVAETLGIEFFKKNFNIPEKEFVNKDPTKSALIDHPLGYNGFPDYAIDLTKLSNSETIKNYLNITDTKYLLVDTKSGVMENRGAGNYRLQYQPASIINTIVQKATGVENLIEMNSEAYPKQLPASVYIELIKAYSNKSYLSDDKVNNLLSDNTPCILFQDVGKNSNTVPTYTQVVIPSLGSILIMEKVSDNRYTIMNEKGKILSSLDFYMSDMLKSGLGNHILDDIVSIQSASKEEKQALKAQGVTISSLLRDNTPFEAWTFMFKFASNGLKDLPFNASPIIEQVIKEDDGVVMSSDFINQCPTNVGIGGETGDQINKKARRNLTVMLNGGMNAQLESSKRMYFIKDLDSGKVLGFDNKESKDRYKDSHNCKVLSAYKFLKNVEYHKSTSDKIALDDKNLDIDITK
jgi:hypothetical protein